MPAPFMNSSARARCPALIKPASDTRSVRLNPSSRARAPSWARESSPNSTRASDLKSNDLNILLYHCTDRLKLVAREGIYEALVRDVVGVRAWLRFRHPVGNGAASWRGLAVISRYSSRRCRRGVRHGDEVERASG